MWETQKIAENNRKPMKKEIDELVRDLCSVDFRMKSATRKKVEQFVSEYKAKIIQIGEGMKKSLEEICKTLKHKPVHSCRYMAKKEVLSAYIEKIKEA